MRVVPDFQSKPVSGSVSSPSQFSEFMSVSLDTDLNCGRNDLIVALSMFAYQYGKTYVSVHVPQNVIHQKAFSFAKCAND
jgi:hypothetical protein